MTTTINGSSPSITFSDGTTQTTAANITAPYTSTGVVYASSTTALATGSALTYSGGILSLNVASAYLNVTVPSGSTTYFGDAVSLVVGAGATDTAIRYDGNNLLFAKGSAKKLTLDTTGNLTFNASNAGIIFNNSGALTNSTLNDYEAGTWTPVPSPQGGSVGTYTSSGTYTKIGRLVFVTGIVSLTSVSSASGVMYISGYPFANGSSVLAPEGLAIEVNLTGTSYGCRINSSATTGFIAGLSTGGVVWTNGGSYQFSITYYS
jgi:hypothetical protein